VSAANHLCLPLIVISEREAEAQWEVCAFGEPAALFSIAADAQRYAMSRASRFGVVQLDWRATSRVGRAVAATLAKAVRS
jgi:hypothetical protein